MSGTTSSSTFRTLIWHVAVLLAGGVSLALTTTQTTAQVGGGGGGLFVICSQECEGATCDDDLDRCCCTNNQSPQGPACFCLNDWEECEPGAGAIPTNSSGCFGQGQDSGGSVS